MIKSRNKFLITNHKTKSGIIVVILAGGLGTRLAEYTKKIPKPMVKVGGLPIIHHIILHYKKFGLTNFVIAAGYKSRIIKKYFHNKFKSIDIKVVNTGLKTMTGGRIKRVKKYLNNETFLLTYGDGISSVNIKNLIKFHKKNKKLATLTAVRPPARFGAIKISKNTVKVFKEKSKIDIYKNLKKIIMLQFYPQKKVKPNSFEDIKSKIYHLRCYFQKEVAKNIKKIF